jgi:hypothetical protein
MISSFDHPLHRLGRTAFLVAAVGAALCVLGLAVDGAQVVRSYLVAWLYWTGASLGSVALLMINHVTGGAWGVAIRRFLEAMMRLLPLLAVAFLPIALGLPTLYEWARPGGRATTCCSTAAVPERAVLPRTDGRCLIWTSCRVLTRWSDAQDTTTDAQPTSAWISSRAAASSS